MSRDDAFKRIFGNVHICMDCNAKMRAPPPKVKAGRIQCRKCGSYALRVKSKESRG